MLTAKVDEIINWVYSNFKDELVKTHILEAKDKDGIFRKMYALKRSGRYDSARRYTFQDDSLNKEFEEWQKTAVTLDMYYGSGTVD